MEVLCSSIHMKFETMEWFNTMGKVHTIEMGIISMERSLNPNYMEVCFNFVKGGGKVSTFNASSDEKDSIFTPCYRVLFVICLVLFLVWG